MKDNSVFLRCLYYKLLKYIKTLPLFTEVVGGYKISSMPFDDKKDAYDEINSYWQGDANVTTYFKDGKWYIISK